MVTRTQLSQLQALEQFAPSRHLLTTGLGLRQKKYRIFSPCKLINVVYYLLGMFSNRDVANSICRLLNSENVQAYLRQNPTQAKKIQRNITLLDMKFSGKGNTALKRVQAAQIQINATTKRRFQEAAQLPATIPQKVREQVITRLEATYPNMKITDTLGAGFYGKVYLFTYGQGAEVKKRVLKLSSWETGEKNAKSYQMNQDRRGGEWLALLEHGGRFMRTFQAIARCDRTGEFVLIDRKKLQEFHRNPNLLGNDSYQLIGTVMEYIEGAEELNPGKDFSRAQIRQIFKNLLQAVVDMHANKVMHRDLKPKNLLMTPDGVKVIDFGTSKAFAKKGHRRKHSESGDIVLMSPARAVNYWDRNELVDYDERTDVYSVAMTIYTLLCQGRTPGGVNLLSTEPLTLDGLRNGPWMEYHKDALGRGLSLADTPEIQALGDRQLADLIGKLSRPQIEQRPFASEALKHPYFSA